jgi:hypothetical protein
MVVGTPKIAMALLHEVSDGKRYLRAVVDLHLAIMLAHCVSTVNAKPNTLDIDRHSNKTTAVSVLIVPCQSESSHGIAARTARARQEGKLAQPNIKVMPPR